MNRLGLLSKGSFEDGLSSVNAGDSNQQLPHSCNECPHNRVNTYQRLNNCVVRVFVDADTPSIGFLEYEEPEAVLARLRAALAEPVSVDDRGLEPVCEGGVALSPNTSPQTRSKTR